MCGSRFIETKIRGNKILLNSRQAGGDDYRPVAFLSNVSDPRYRNRVYLDRNRGILYCPVYKAATTTWLNNFILLHEETTMVQQKTTKKFHFSKEVLVSRRRRQHSARG